MRDFKDIKIAVAGTGYVGLSIATLLSQHHHVTTVDVIPEKVEKLNNKISPIQDDYIEKYLAEKDLNLTATLDGAAAYKDADYVVIAAPTNYDPQKNFFDTHHIEDVIDLVLSVNQIYYSCRILPFTLREVCAQVLDRSFTQGQEVQFAFLSRVPSREQGTLR